MCRLPLESPRLTLCPSGVLPQMKNGIVSDSAKVKICKDAGGPCAEVHGVLMDNLRFQPRSETPSETIAVSFNSKDEMPNPRTAARLRATLCCCNAHDTQRHILHCW